MVHSQCHHGSVSVIGVPPGDLPQLFGLERRRLLELLATLEAADWARETPCPGWSVLGLVSHLVNGDLGMLSRHRDDFLGTRPPTGADESEFIEWLDDLMQQWVTATRGLSPRVSIGLLAWSGPQIVQHFADQDPMARTAHVQWAGTEPAPVWLNQVRELSEFWIHRQQLLDALGRDPDLRSDVLGPVFDGLRWAYPYRLAGLKRPAGSTVTIDISGPVTTTWHLVVSDEGWAFSETPGQELAAISMSTDEAWRLLTNNLYPERQAALRTSGDSALLNVVRHTRAILGAPK
jgi:uncharacterized protein (TIGR03083 family)